MRNRFSNLDISPGVTKLLIANIAIYLCFALLQNTSIGFIGYHSLSLLPAKVIGDLQIWRLFTYGFLHDLSSPFHIIFNALMLYMLGPSIESIMGEKKFLFFSFLAIFVGGLFVLASYLLKFGASPVVGFSSATIAMVIAWGIYYRENTIYMFGLLPLTGKQLVFFTIGIEILFAASSSGISSAAHLGGIAASLIVTLKLYKLNTIKNLIKR